MLCQTDEFQLNNHFLTIGGIHYTNLITVISGIMPTLPGYPKNPKPRFTYNF